MSKPSSGHFKGTIGGNASSKNVSHNLNNDGIIKGNGFDTRAHPTKYKQLSSKKLKALREKEAARTLTKAEYKHKEWQRRLSIRRRAGIDAFWERERELIDKKLPTTRKWSAEQRDDILNNKRPKFKGVTMQSHHTYSVAQYPHLANIGSLIYPATQYEHHKRWHGGNYKNSLPGKPVDNHVNEEF